MSKEIKKYISYKVPKKNIGTRSRTNFTVQHLDVLPRLVEPDKYFYFIRNNETSKIEIPQLETCQDEKEIARMKLVAKRIDKFFKPKCSLHNFQKDFENEEFVEGIKHYCRKMKEYNKMMQQSFQEIKKQQLASHHEKRRREDLPVFPQAYSTNWKVIKHFENVKKQQVEEVKISQELKKLSRKGLNVTINGKQC